MKTFAEYRKIDTHVHIVPSVYSQGMEKYLGGNPDRFPVPPWSPEKHLEFMDQLNIAGSAVSISSPHLNFSIPGVARDLARRVNAEGAELASRHPGRFALIASLPLANVKDSVAEVEYAHGSLKAVGFTLPTNTRGMYATSPFLEPVFEALNDKGAVVTFHPNKPTAVPG